LIRFFDNHGLLSLHSQPKWKVVSGGSQTYIPRLTAPVTGGIYEGAAIQAVRRGAAGITVTFRDRAPMAFDEVVFACHGDQVLPLLAEPSEAEREIFTSFTTTANTAWLHTDASVLPVQARARASWNYLLGADSAAPPMVTYDLNRLQGLTTPEQYCVTLNPTHDIDQRRVLRRFVYQHPLYTRAAIRAQGQWRAVSGVNRTHYCGAYWFSRLPRGRIEFRAQGRAWARSRVVIESGLFVGTLRHRRFTTVPHSFSYPLFMALLDVDRVPELMRVSRLTGCNRWNWASFDDRDHLGDPARPLRERLALDAARHGIDLPAGRIFLLTHLRYLGYCFNPVSFFYCFDDTERLRLVLAEVRNTFGGGHNYWLRPDPLLPGFRAAAAKALYVSPFMPVDLDYAFTFTPPAGHLVAHMATVKAGAVCLDATLSLERRPWEAREIRRALIRHPMMTANVVAGIHWQALGLWWKGVPVIRRITRDGVGERAAWEAGSAGRADQVAEQ